ncbi:MAG: hypothetical protein H0W68_00575, partial [Gemmatimonadaceae bacterium]|nr:hypothetical protein [Gemmatimonadaceae bacterium]
MNRTFRHHAADVRHAFLLASVLAASAALPASAQTTSPTAPPPVLASQNDPRPSVRAVPRAGAVSIDGRLDESAWSAAEVISDLHQQQPDEGKPPTERTELRIL